MGAEGRGDGRGSGGMSHSYHGDQTDMLDLVQGTGHHGKRNSGGASGMKTCIPEEGEKTKVIC